MAAANGGNVAATVTDERVVTDNGVTILGYTDLAGRLAAQTSQLYGTNIVNLLKLLTPGKDGAAHPRPGRRRPARHHRVAGPARPCGRRRPCRCRRRPGDAGAAGGRGAPPPKPADPRRKWYAAGLGAVALRACCASLAPSSFLGHFTVFALAVVVGYYVISNVSHALHTPLMSGDQRDLRDHPGRRHPAGRQRQPRRPMLLALVAVLVASINIFGGFLVTLRMLEMFRKD